MLPHWRQVGSRAAGRVLTSFWQAIGACNYRIGSGSSASTQLMLDLSRLFSPYQLNPFDINPLRKIISEVIDFDALRSRRSIRLFIAATRLSTGTLKLFKNAELSIDALLASACLPTFSQAIEIDGESYWDGAYSGNPAIYPLLYQCRAPDILVVRLQPMQRESLPTSADAIRARVVDFQFNAAFLREMRSLAIAKREIDKEWLPLGKLAKKVKQLNFHLIEADDMIGKMRIEKSFNADLAFLLKLKEEGRQRADAWLVNTPACSAGARRST